jgi:dienelactone hydrolase
MKPLSLPFWTLVLLLVPLGVSAANPPFKPTPGDRMLDDYFRQETARIADQTLAGIRTLDEWKSKRDGYRQELFEMLGLSPLPAKTDLKPVITGTIDQADFTVEKLHFQSLPGLYVTANLYLPKGQKKPAPAVLYVCGHSRVKTNGVSYGNKTSYQHHGIWFARNGYVCLIIDTVQLGELEGIHHGTYREGMWWWNSRGYSSAAAEAWNCIRSLDYLQARPEVDGSRIGVTGRSGGGAYSWWVAALDERIKAACPVAGITDLQNYVVDGCVEGHCDCMFTVNTYRWDYAKVAALVAPRPLMICNSDKDAIFPLEGVVRIHENVRKIYRLYGNTNDLALLITEGPHKDTQDLQVPVFRWFNRHLKGEESLVSMAAVKMFTPQQLKVFEKPPADERTTRIYETFVSLANPAAGPKREEAMTALREKTFRGWPQEAGGLNVKEVFSAERKGMRLVAYDFDSEQGVRLRCYAIHRADVLQPANIRVSTVDQAAWQEWLAAVKGPFGDLLAEELRGAGVVNDGDFEALLNVTIRSIGARDDVYVTFAPRGAGLTAMANEPKHLTQMRRRFMLLGQTLAGMQAWDVRRGVQALRSVEGFKAARVELGGAAAMDGVNVFAALFEPGVTSLQLVRPPRSDKEWPDFLNYARIVTPAQAVDLVRERTKVEIKSPE